jgi:hypothetical protein
LKSSSKLNMPTRFIPELLGRQICLASDLCTTATTATCSGKRKAELLVSATRLTCLIRAPASQRGEFDADSPMAVQPASRRATFSCGPSNRASNSVMSSEVSSARIRNRASGDGTRVSARLQYRLRLSAGSPIQSLSQSNQKGPAPREISAGQKRAPLGRTARVIAL